MGPKKDKIVRKTEVPTDSLGDTAGDIQCRREEREAKEGDTATATDRGGREEARVEETHS